MMGTLRLNRPLSRSRLSGAGAEAVSRAVVRDEPAPAPAPAKVERRACDKATWRERMAVDLHAMTGGETPAAFRWLVDARAPALPLMVGAAAAFEARYPGVDRGTAGAWLGRLCRYSRYLFALSADGAMRHDLDGLPVAPVSDEHRKRAVAMRSKGAGGQGGKA